MAPKNWQTRVIILIYKMGDSRECTTLISENLHQPQITNTAGKFNCKLTQHTLNTEIKKVTYNFSTLCPPFLLSLLECVAAYWKLVSHNSLF